MKRARSKAVVRRTRRAVPRLAVVIPTLNEQDHLPVLLDALALQSLPIECVVADGGSTDATAACVSDRGLQLVGSARGRAVQMNAGAAATRAPYLLFLHADSKLDSPQQLEQAVQALETARAQRPDRVVAGHFALRFEREQPGREALFRFMQAKSASGRPGTINGDQGVLIAREDFLRLGGFDERLPFFEDQRLAKQIFDQGEWILLPGVLHTSARRFEREGHLPRYALMGLMMLMHEAGIESFFTRARGVYAQQDQTQPLSLQAFLDLARELLLDAWRTQPMRAIEMGRFVSANAWQLALMLDLLRQSDRPEDQIALRRFDRTIAPLLDHPAAQVLAAGFAALSLFAVLPWAERRGVLK